MVAACGLDPKRSGAPVRHWNSSKSEPFHPTQRAAFADWFDAPRSEMNSVAAFGGLGDCEAALR
jgi:hypothetical protein